MADFNKAIPNVLKWEAGWVKNPADPGGATNRGIIFSIFVKWATELGMQPTEDALKNLTEDQAKKIYKGQFWNKMQGDKFESQDLANIVFDGFVNCGHNGIKLLQEILGVTADGEIGPKTLTAINVSNPHIVFGLYKSARIKYYNDLAIRKPEMKIFLKGWLNRINSFNL